MMSPDGFNHPGFDSAYFWWRLPSLSGAVAVVLNHEPHDLNLVMKSMKSASGHFLSLLACEVVVG